MVQRLKQNAALGFGPKSTALSVQKHVAGRDVKADELEMM